MLVLTIGVGKKKKSNLNKIQVPTYFKTTRFVV